MTDDSLKTELAPRIDPICQQFELAWHAGEQPSIDEFAALANAADREALRTELERLDVAFRQQRLDSADSHSAPSTLGDARPAGGNGDEYLTTPPNVSAATVPGSDMPAAFGRYHVTGRLGKGAFGVVYRGHDPDLRRDVAIKVPRRDRIASPADAEAYLAEARVLATLNHPGIVQAHDFGRTADGLCYVVSQFISGGDLARRIARGRPSHDEAADLVARISEALHYAHQHGLVHRDIKPGNILIDQTGRPLVADFGLALSDKSYGRQAGVFGTPAYMSPEQARGEGHRVDARSDIYSLGVVFYELLTGRRPYRNHTLPELFDEMSSGETRPPRQFDHTIPKELERICLKSLAKRAADRYTTAFDLAEDLRHWYDHRNPHTPCEGNHHAERDAYGGQAGGTSALPVPPDPQTGTVGRGEGGQRAASPKIIPKGLRSFDAHDADFFLQLLPGPTDRDGLPESIRFWKTRVEAFDADETFSVGLLYGPSGCGKSSLVKAGLLPRLAPNVTTIFLEAAPDDTESRLLRGLRKLLPLPLGVGRGEGGLPRSDALSDLIAQLRRGRQNENADSTGKVLIVLDQFEQWLHAHRDPANSELVQALRQCDGAHVQCLVMVRDDFWMAASRFMQALETPLVEGANSASVDLFDTLHARKVLTLFGRAYGRLPDVGQAFQPDVVAGNRQADSQARKPDLHDQFLDAAVAGLAEGGKVVSVRMALFAEMVKGKLWTPATLKEIGGISGVGVTFLEETFSSSTAPPRHRFHQQAARAVLKALLPDAGTDMKSHRRSREELLIASGYARRPADFAELLRMLDSELRLITPADDDGRMAFPGRPEDDEGLSGSDELEGSREAAKARRESPNLLRAFAASRESSAETSPDADPEQTGNDPQFHAGATEQNPKSYQLTHDYLVPSLRDWLTRKQRETRRGRAELLLAERTAFWESKHETRQLPSLPEYLSAICFVPRRTRTARQHEMLRQAGAYHLLWTGGALVVLTIFWAAAVGLHQVETWNRVRDAVSAVRDSGTIPPDLRALNALPRESVLQPLKTEYSRLRSRNPASQERLRLAYALAEYGERDLTFLASHIEDATPQETNRLIAVFGDSRAPRDESLKPLHDLAKKCDEQRKWRLKARLALMALHRGDDRIAADMCRIDNRPDPIQRTIFIDELPKWHADLPRLANVWDNRTDPSVRSGMCLVVGSVPLNEVSDWGVKQLQKVLTKWYETASDAGTHSAAGWALRAWKQPLPPLEQAADLPPGRCWHVNREGMTMIKIPAGKLAVGEGELKVERPFLLGDREVTIGEFQRFIDDPEYAATEKPDNWLGPYRHDGQTPDCPVQQVSWYDAVLYCNWLSKREGKWLCYSRNGAKQTFLESRNGKQENVDYDEWDCDFRHNGYRLPTQVEWEYACGAVSTTTYSFGDNYELLGAYAWFSNNSRSRAWPGGIKLPNAWGLFDMHGNVTEWCYDWQDNGPLGRGRVHCGSGWGYYAADCQTAASGNIPSAHRDGWTGFRLARSFVEPE
jgi:serine/threonine protein kinase/formylglycine-generating enzyme required for sulfatase activity